MSIAYLRPENEPRWQNRKGPGGIDLDPSEAMTWFPELDEAPNATSVAITPGCSARLECRGVTFWVHDIVPSLEPGFYFGDIEEFPGPACDEKYYCLGPDQNIGFEPRHVLEVLAPGSRPSTNRKP